MKMKLLVLMCMLILLVPALTSAATIYGTIYDFELNTAANSIVEINTVPKQSFVAKNGAYSFTVPLGNYTIKAAKDGSSAAEEAVIVAEGKFLIDLILFPDLSEEEEILNESELDVSDEYFEEKNESNYYYIIAGFAALIALLLAAIFIYKKKFEKKMKEEIKEEIKTVRKETAAQNAEKGLPAELKELLEFIKKEGGRATQKDVRKNFPQSEAKISLMIAELESMGKIKKIKKGRGNIIVLK